MKRREHSERRTRISIKETMKSLQQHNQDAARRYSDSEAVWRRLEVECPKCGSAIAYDSRIAYMSQPPQVDARCTVCPWTDKIVKP